MSKLVAFASRTSPTFNISMGVKNSDDEKILRKVAFSNHRLELDISQYEDEQVYQQLKKLIATRPDISQEIYEIDRNAALELAKKHQMNQPPAAIQGQTTSMHNPAHQAMLQKRADELRRSGVSEDDIQKMLDQMNTDLQLTKPGTVHRDSGEGFTPEPDDKPVQEVVKENSSAQDVSKAFKALGKK